MPNHFDMAFSWSLENEGEDYVDDPDDRGGPTKFGITRRSWSDYVGHEVTPETIAALTREDARAFYRETYWEALKLDEVSSPLCAMAIFDLAILCGRLAAIKMAQCAAGVSADGVMGPRTLAALNAARPAVIVVALVRIAVQRFTRIVTSTPTQMRYFAGWVGRALRFIDLVAAGPI